MNKKTRSCLISHARKSNSVRSRQGLAPSGEFFKGGEKNDSKQEVGEGGIIENNIHIPLFIHLVSSYASEKYN